MIRTFMKKRNLKTSKKDMTNITCKFDEDKTKWIAELFLPYERGYKEKSNALPKNMALMWLD